MLTRAEIKKNLLKDPYWEPEGKVTDEEWKIFDEVYDELEEKGELSFDSGEDDEPLEGYDFDDADDDDDEF